MGKYMKKSKTTGDVAVMDLTLGVRTRAKTLALQQLQSPAPYHLRSRRHLKPHPSTESRRQRQSRDSCNSNPNFASSEPLKNNRNGSGGERASGSRTRAGQVSGSGAGGPVQNEEEVEVEENVSKKGGSGKEEEGQDLGVEASLGENVLEIDSRERSTRESTPCSLIRDPEIVVETPGSTTRPTSSTETNRRTQRRIPTSQEMRAFFAKAEQEQLQEFIEKYNFDPVNEKPLPGRYEWEKVDP